MNCLTKEQLVAIAIGIVDESIESAHVAECEHCRARIAEFRRLNGQLLAAHAETARNLASSRPQLLARLEELDAVRTSGWLRGIRSRIDSLSIGRRIAAGIGATGIAATALLVVITASMATPTAAMERMARQLRAVTSFSFEPEETSDRITGDNRRRIQRSDTTYWNAAPSWRGTTRLVKLPLPPAPGESGELLVDVEEIYTKGQPGILIDHKAKTFFRTPEMQPDSFPDYSPINWAQRMSAGAVKVLSDLGTKQLGDQLAHGYIVSLGHPEPDSGQNAVHLWVDTETDLPIEFRYEESGGSNDSARESGADTWTNVMHVYNFRWNVEFDANLFQPIEPLGYDDTSWPRDDKTVEEMVQALRLYARLSGGHYPRVAEFHGGEVQAEMLKLAGSVESPQSDSDREKLLLEIQNAHAGLDWIAQTLRNKHHTGYYGAEVGPSDKHKVLMWWPVDIEDAYHVIYGDLRTETLPLAEWSKLVPRDVAESHTPAEYSKPGR